MMSIDSQKMSSSGVKAIDTADPLGATEPDQLPMASPLRSPSPASPLATAGDDDDDMRSPAQVSQSFAAMPGADQPQPSSPSLDGLVLEADYDARSPHQRPVQPDIQDSVAEDGAEAMLTTPLSLWEARESKLTPKVPERHLPLVDDDDDEEISEAKYNEDQENVLVGPMTALKVEPGKPMPLKGLPVPQGKHLRWGDEGQVTASPQRPVLRGMPPATGKITRFD